MPLDVFVQTDPDVLKGRHNAPYRHVCSRDDDGYYWFMETWFRRLADETSDYIDLYGAAVFSGETLDKLSAMLAEITAEITSYPMQWEVETGRITEPQIVIFRKVVLKTSLQTLLGTLSGAVEEAKVQNAFLIFFGD